MIAVGALLAAAALVGVLHMSAPDHWVTLVLLGRIAEWTKGRLLLVSLLTAAGHVLLSIVLGFAIVGVGAVFSQALSHDLVLVTGAIMVAGGGAYGVRELLSEPSEDYEREAGEELMKLEKGVGRGAGYFAVLGAALSPDLSILPIFVLAVPEGFGVAADTALVFAAASVLSLLVLVVAGSKGLATLFEKVPPKYNDALVGFIIALVGVYVLVAG